MCSWRSTRGCPQTSGAGSIPSFATLYAGRNLTLTTRMGDLDIVQRLPGVPPWAELVADAEQTSLGDVPLAVCSREHLIAMKRARHSLQDQTDVAALLVDE